MEGLTHVKRIAVDRWLVNMTDTGTSWASYLGGNTAHSQINTAFTLTCEF